MVNDRGHGGYRPGAGRPTGTGKFGEKTKPIRVPRSLLPQITELLKAHKAGDKKIFMMPQNVDIMLPDQDAEHSGAPFYSGMVAAGFPSPADDHQESKLDLNEYLVSHPAATFFVRVQGLSMIDAGIQPDDILVVDRSLDPAHGKVIVAALDGELTVKRLNKKNGQITLMPENDDYDPIEITAEMSFIIWGVVTSVIHKV
jgi:DNA polymerase V